MRHATSFGVLLLALCAGCGSSASPQQGENYGNLYDSPAGLILVRDEHPTGWTRPDCFTCHEIRSIHTVNRTGLPDCPSGTPPPTPVLQCLDLAAVRAIVQHQGEASCPQCHGDNGVAP